MTMLSRVAGLVRDMVIAAMFGATANADALFLA
jgi:putative peptidoglycan lipid II flippase